MSGNRKTGNKRKAVDGNKSGCAPPPLRHRRWPGCVRDAIALQNVLAPGVERADRLTRVDCVAGVDVAFEDGGDTTRAAVVAFRLPELVACGHAVVRLPTRFPYVPGLLSFREVPAMARAIGQLDVRPDLLLVDGQGIAHPRRLGVASHLGLELDIPAVGVAKSRLVGEHGTVPDVRGAWCPLLAGMHRATGHDRAGQEVIGAVLRTRVGVRPVFVSIGHRISLPTALRLVMDCTRRFRLPEPIRAADRLSKGAPPTGSRASLRR
jgi:deoxyribonuclease V